ncbi:MAG TPA: MmcQ/YjbR family DNA-binding protein [Frankiaceae bacterium]|nr:MmcQ/YjbR family DNA-binding protein [Frankiaceae bacterium]
MTARLDRLRKVCLALPEATEVLTWEDHPTFRVRDKIFVIAAADGGAITLKATKDDQEALVATHPRITPAPYLARSGWVSVDLTGKGLDWAMVEDLILDSYRLIAPKRLSAQLAR